MFQAGCSDRTVRSGDLRAVLGEADPGFWPSRGRRTPPNGAEADVVDPLFWANRGRYLLPLPILTPLYVLLKREDMEPWIRRSERRVQ